MRFSRPNRKQSKHTPSTNTQRSAIRSTIQYHTNGMVPHRKPLLCCLYLCPSSYPPFLRTLTTPKSRSTTPWKLPSTSAAELCCSGTGDEEALLRASRRGPSTEEDRRRDGGGGGPRRSCSPSRSAPNTIMAVAVIDR